MRVPTAVLAGLIGLAATAGSAQPAVASHEAVVYVTASGFSPGSVTIASGDRIRFTVRDHKPHQLAKTSGPDSGDVAPNVLEGQGSSVTLALAEPGTYLYVDRLNPRHAEFRVTMRR